MEQSFTEKKLLETSSPVLTNYINWTGTKEYMLTLTEYNKLHGRRIFKTGKGMDGRREIRWVAVKFTDSTWSLFYKHTDSASPWDGNPKLPTWQEWAEKENKRIRYFGKTMRIIKRVQRLVECDNEVIKLYRC